MNRINLSLFAPADDFFSDRLCRRYGVIVLVGVAIMMTYGLTRPDALVCWPPAHFGTTWSAYSHTTCWNDGILRKFSYENYYENHIREFDLNAVKHFPVTLIVMVFVFLLPRAPYDVVGQLSDFSTQSLIIAANNAAHDSSMFSSVASRVTSYLGSPLPFSNAARMALGGYTLTVVYLLKKLGYLVACIIQFAIISGYFGFNFYTYRFNSANRKHVQTTSQELDENTTVWSETETFPRTVMCDFMVGEHACTRTCILIYDAVRKCRLVNTVALTVYLNSSSIIRTYSW